jgi:hypothetical protein
MSYRFYLENPDDRLRAYFCTLSPQVQRQIAESQVEITTLGELQTCAEHFRQQLLQ